MASHHCKAVLVTCMDFRLHQRADGRNYTADFIRRLRIDCDLITRGGSIQDLVRSKEGSGFDKSLLRDSKVSAKLHQVETVYLINHEDCGAYGEMDFSSREEEIAQHEEDLKKAREIINEEFPDVKVELFFGDLKEGTSDEYSFRKVE